jgi:hypothetical protein
MKRYAFLTATFAITAFLCVVTAIEAPRKPKKTKDKIYVLPLVEEMATNPTPFSL